MFLEMWKNSRNMRRLYLSHGGAGLYNKDDQQASHLLGGVLNSLGGDCTMRKGAYRKNLGRRMLAWFLAACMCVGMIPASGAEEEAQPREYFYDYMVASPHLRGESANADAAQDLWKAPSYAHVQNWAQAAGRESADWCYGGYSPGTQFKFAGDSYGVRLGSSNADSSIGKYGYLKIQVPQAGLYDIRSLHRHASDQGIVSFYLAPADAEDPRAEEYRLATFDTCDGIADEETRLAVKELAAGEYLISYEMSAKSAAGPASPIFCVKGLRLVGLDEYRPQELQYDYLVASPYLRGAAETPNTAQDLWRAPSYAHVRAWAEAARRSTEDWCYGGYPSGTIFRFAHEEYGLVLSGGVGKYGYLKIHVPENGVYDVTSVNRFARDQGKVNVYLSPADQENPVAEAHLLTQLDTWRADAVQAEAAALGRRQLTAGDWWIAYELAGVSGGGPASRFSVSAPWP